jgi:hypothetical protein
MCCVLCKNMQSRVSFSAPSCTFLQNNPPTAVASGRCVVYFAKICRAGSHFLHHLAHFCRLILQRPWHPAGVLCTLQKIRRAGSHFMHHLAHFCRLILQPPWHPAGVLRTLQKYAEPGLILCTILHILFADSSSNSRMHNL